MLIRPSALGREVIRCGIEVHRNLGPGLLESAYKTALGHELGRAGIRHAVEVPIDVTYQGKVIGRGFRADFIIDRQIVIEVKAVEAFAPVHFAQMLTYLRFSGLEEGFLMNFNVTRFRRGLRRVLLDTIPASPTTPVVAPSA
jgi:GxxExxY protein